MIKLRKGWTFIELILVVLVLGTVATVTAPIIDSAVNSWSFVMYRSELWQNAEIAFSRMATETREIRGTSDVITANAQTLAFTTVTGENITYSHTGNTLYRNGDILIGNINAFAFSYFDENGGSIAAPLVAPTVTNIRIIRFYIVLGPTGQTFTLETDVHPRNLE